MACCNLEEAVTICRFIYSSPIVVDFIYEIGFNGEIWCGAWTRVLRSPIVNWQFAVSQHSVRIER